MMKWKTTRQIEMYHERLQKMLGKDISVYLGAPPVLKSYEVPPDLCMDMLTGDLYKFLKRSRRWRKQKVSKFDFTEFLEDDDPLLLEMGYKDELYYIQREELLDAGARDEEIYDE